MTSIAENSTFEEMTLEEIDLLETAEAVEIINQVSSNTKWEDTSNHITYNGVKMCK